MILRELSVGAFRILLEIRPYLQEFQSPTITPAEVDALAPFMVIVVAGPTVLSRQGFATFDEADGRNLNPGSWRSEVEGRGGGLLPRALVAFERGDPDMLIKKGRRRGPPVP